MAVPFSNTKLRVPKGFQNILECLAREVLRSQPDNIHEFAAAYFESLLRVRAETGHDPAVHGARLEDRNYNNEAYKKRPADPYEAQEKTVAATTIQNQYRQHMSKEEVGNMRNEDAAIKIQAGFRGFMGREQVRQMKGDHPAEPDENDIEFDLNAPDVEKAAIKIQAGFKGYKARKQLLAEQNGTEEETHLESHSDQEEDIDQDLTDPEVHRAAVKIQAGFRGYHTRKQWKDQTKNEADENSPDDGKEDDLENIDLKDPDLSIAALKIQAGFRGLKSRKELQRKKELRQQEESQEQNVDEEVDIDLTDPDVEKAALKIQAGFKGLKARKGLREKTEVKPQDEDEVPEDEVPEDDVPVKYIVDDLDLDQADLAAVRIQAGYRGYMSRKTTKEISGTQEVETADESDDESKHEQPANDDDEEIDIDLTDPEVEKATIKLQAGFKGFMARKQAQAQAGDLRAVVTPVEESQGQESEIQNEGKLQLNESSTDIFTEDADDGVQRKSVDEIDLGKEKAAMKIQAGYRGMKARREVKVIRENGKEVEQTFEEKEEAEEEVEHLFEEEPDEM